MAFVPHFYTDYQFSPQEFSDINSVMAQENYGNNAFAGGAISTACAMMGREHNHRNNLPIFYDNINDNGALEGFPPESTDVFSRLPAVTTSFADQLGVSDVAVPSLIDHYKMGFSSIAKIQNLGGGFQYNSGPFEFGDDCCEFLQNFKSICPDSRETWGIQCNQMPAIEHSNIKVGRYTVEERKDRILRYLKKRNQRNFNKTIKYACRKTLADRRVRVRGRFARNNELIGEDETGSKKNDNPLQEKESYFNDALQMKNSDDDDDWLQEAVASLMYVPYIAG
ncbi:hypothetical protein JCGZ_22637 [Jatropha curcas]|uniref:CCT domain-containing protein n=1 Tax=Jatropha curcas TaxID=180498 RepID=A0A067JMH8_JATCU|nr:uncharacterized protein LOC105646260 [Jatropha curcas]KDP25102.1 hypothetical protein JCGZ_22637 [Jatropha curcas]